MNGRVESSAVEFGGPVLVTGATGFLGGRLLARLLAAGRSVVAISRVPRPELEARGVRVVTGALHDPAVAAEAVRGAETVFHVAARVGVWGRLEDFERDNVEATRVLIAAARAAGVRRFVHTSTPSVVYNGRDLAGADETLPLTENCPSPYPLTKARAERAALAASTDEFRVCALRPHLIWGVGDPHLVPRILERARAGRLTIVGRGDNRVDMAHVDNVADAHLLAERALGASGTVPGPAAGRAYFITNDEPVRLWDWVNELLARLGERPVRRRVSLPVAYAVGGAAEWWWRTAGRSGEPPLTRFVAAELAKDHWFDIGAARRDLGYAPAKSMAEGMEELVRHLRAASTGRR